VKGLGVHCFIKPNKEFLLFSYRGCVFSFLLLSFCITAKAADYFPPLAYSESGAWVLNQSSPSRACNLYASLWKWDVKGYTAKLERVQPGLWVCQRYYLGARDDHMYTYIRGVCQISPAPIKKGSYWEHPSYTPEKSSLCYCPGSKVFDNSIQWCDWPLSSVPSLPKQAGLPSISSNEPSLCVGNPINLATGNKFELELDFISKNNSVRFERFYNSYDGVWSHSFSSRVIVDGEYMTLIHQDGRHELFTIAGIYAYSNTGSGGYFTKENNNWVYKDSSARSMEFNSKGELIGVKYRHGGEVYISYGESSFVVAGESIESLHVQVDTLGQPLTLYMGGLRFDYIYDASGNLIRVTKFSQGETSNRIYHYENTNKPKMLTGITDERGVRFATWSYDELGRAITSKHAGDTELTKVMYNLDGSSTVTNELGRKTIYKFQTIQGVKHIVSIEGEPSANCPNSNSTFTYDSRGLLKTKTDNKGHLTTYDYNTRGLEVSRTEAAGTPQARTITTDWHPTLFLPVTVTEPARTTTYTYDVQGRQLSQSVTQR
jgi:YD repeat-containing protein